MARQAPTTDKLYLNDSYTTEFDARVVACEPAANDLHALTLDRTYFYPESGGQLCDRGRIAGATVTRVWEEGDKVHHEVSESVAIGPVSCGVDWQRRFDHMQQHTGQHVLSRAFIVVADLDTVSFHMGDDHCTIDLDSGGAVDNEVIVDAERLANEVVWQDRPVTVRWAARDTIDEPLLRKELPGDLQEVRLVEIEDFDVIGCGGTHVRRTGELGLVKVLKQENVKGAARIHFNVGRRAFAGLAAAYDTMRELATRYTTSLDTIGDKVAKLDEAARDSRRELQGLSRRLAAIEKQSLIGGARESGGCRIVSALIDAGSAYVRLLGGEMKREAGTVSVLASRDGLVVCNAGRGVDIDLASLALERAESLGGAGGGKGGFVTVQLPDGVDPRAFVTAVSKAIEEALS